MLTVFEIIYFQNNKPGKWTSILFWHGCFEPHRIGGNDLPDDAWADRWNLFDELFDWAAFATGPPHLGQPQSGSSIS